jgi:hypothetical protein
MALDFPIALSGSPIKVAALPEVTVYIVGMGKNTVLDTEKYSIYPIYSHKPMS